MVPLPALLASLVCGGGEWEYIFSRKSSFFHQSSSVLVVMPSSHSKSDEVAAGASSAQLTNTSFQVISFPEVANGNLQELQTSQSRCKVTQSSNSH